MIIVNIKWSFCKYIWESHVVLPLIDIEELQDFIENLNIENNINNNYNGWQNSRNKYKMLKNL